jgi:hypothetical protein
MADNTKAKKGLPNRAASSHPSHARNQKSWARGENRRAEHRFDQNVRRDVNIARCAGGELTPWQMAEWVTCWACIGAVGFVASVFVGWLLDR